VPRWTWLSRQGHKEERGGRGWRLRS